MAPNYLHTSPLPRLLADDNTTAPLMRAEESVSKQTHKKAFLLDTTTRGVTVVGGSEPASPPSSGDLLDSVPSPNQPTEPDQSIKRTYRHHHHHQQRVRMR